MTSAGLNVWGYRNHFRFSIRSSRWKLDEPASQPASHHQRKGNGLGHRNRHRTQRPEVAVGRRKMPVKSGIRVRVRHERSARKETTITRTCRLLSCFSCQLVSVAAVQSSGQQRRDSQTPGVQCRKYIFNCSTRTLRRMVILCNFVYVYWMYPECILSGIPSVYVTRGNTFNAGRENLIFWNI